MNGMSHQFPRQAGFTEQMRQAKAGLVLPEYADKESTVPVKPVATEPIVTEQVRNEPADFGSELREKIYCAQGHEQPFTGKKGEAHNGDCPLCECEACKNRRYQDRSSDGTVSFQTPTKIRPEEAGNMIRAHEQEHIRNDRIDAELNKREVIAQSIRIIYSQCEECGVTYAAGGEATTITRTTPDYDAIFGTGEKDITEVVGNMLNISA